MLQLPQKLCLLLDKKLLICDFRNLQQKSCDIVTFEIHDKRSL